MNTGAAKTPLIFFSTDKLLVLTISLNMSLSQPVTGRVAIDSVTNCDILIHQ